MARGSRPRRPPSPAGRSPSSKGWSVPSSTCSTPTSSTSRRSSVGGEHRGVVVEPVGELAGRDRRGAGDVLAVPAHVQPAAQRRQAAAAVGQAQVEREALQHPAEHQPGHRQRGLHRVADQLRQPEVGLPVRVRHAAGVQEDERAPLATAAPTASSLTGSSRSRPPPRLPIAMPARPSSSRRAAGLVGGARPAERHRARARAAGPARRRRRWPARRCPAATMPVANCSVVGGGAEQERRQRDRVPAHADVVHLGQPHVHVVLGAGQRQRRHRAHPADPGVEPDDAVGHPGEVGQAALGEPLQQRQRHRVRVHVEGADVRHAVPSHRGGPRSRSTRRRSPISPPKVARLPAHCRRLPAGTSASH